MQEELLHFIWKYKKLQLKDLFTSKNESVSIISVGEHNLHSGPDFFNSKIKIDQQLWAGNVEIHVKSSDWYAHYHEKDTNYNNVILHVVWEDNMPVFRNDNSEIPTLELKNYISENLLADYRNLFDKRNFTFINCEKFIGTLDPFVFSSWQERLFFDRLERKYEAVLQLLEESKNDWEKTLFVLLLKNFGLNINGDSFLSIAKAIDFSIVRKLHKDAFKLESVFFGIAGFLESEVLVDNYYKQLKEEYRYLKIKFNLQSDGVQTPEFFKLRPPNFPTIRLPQIASLYAENQTLFQNVIKASTLKDLYKLLDGVASTYWDTHYVFGKTSKNSNKKLTKKFKDLIIINTIIPLKFCYSKYIGVESNDEIITIIASIKSENNAIVTNFKNLGVHCVNAKETQSVIQLYTQYCTKNKCLQCAVGVSLLNRNG
ncbi:MAG: DUF2851 family protein [Cellulophaga sp.]